jgi:hypothetical protein
LGSSQSNFSRSHVNLEAASGEILGVGVLMRADEPQLAVEIETFELVPTTAAPVAVGVPPPAGRVARVDATRDAAAATERVAGRAR